MVRRTFEHANNPAFRCDPRVLLLPFGRESYLEAIVVAAGGERVELDETTDRIVYRLTGTPAPTTLVYSGMGAPAAVNAVEMAAAAGARTLVLFGACGGMAPTLGVGDLLVVPAAVRGEGASRSYAPRDYPAVADPDLTLELERRACAQAGATVHRGLVFTTDASYRQPSDLYRDYDGLVLGIECEASAVMVAAARLGVAAGALLFCSDNVTLPEASDRRYRGLAEPRVRRGFEAGLAAALAALAAVAAAD